MSLEVSKVLGDKAISSAKIATTATIATRYVATKPIIDRWTTVSIDSPGSSISWSAELDRPCRGGGVGGADGVVVGSAIYADYSSEGWVFPTGLRPRCSQARLVTLRPRGVRSSKPICIK